jgi:hypothetical protein
MEMGNIHAHDRSCPGAGGDAAGWAVNAVRRSLHGSRACAAATRRLPGFLTDLEAVGSLFRTAHETMLDVQGVGLIVAPPGALDVTRHERRLLRAAAAAQAEDDGLVDNYLFKLALHPQARPPLARAVTALATTLAVSGYWLSAFLLPAPALHVARLHGVDLRRIAVLWGSDDGRVAVSLCPDTRSDTDCSG